MQQLSFQLCYKKLLCEIHILVLSAISCDSRISSIWFISDGTIHLSFIGYCWSSSCADELVYFGLHIWLSSWQAFQKKFVNQQVCINTYVFSLNSAPFEGVSCTLLVPVPKHLLLTPAVLLPWRVDLVPQLHYAGTAACSELQETQLERDRAWTGHRTRLKSLHMPCLRILLWG